jgi:hypothetical protein
MRKRFKSALGAVCVLAVLFTASGCFFRISADELYSLPQASEEYLLLQQELNNILSTGAVYSPPIAGSNRQSVQLVDIDGDGVSEVLAFFRATGDKPLKLYVIDQEDGDIFQADIIEGEGTAFERVRYADLDGDGTLEIIVGRQMSSALSYVSVYSLKGGVHSHLGSAEYAELAIVEAGGRSVLVVLRLASAEQPGEAEAFALTADGEMVRTTTQLTKGLLTFARVQSGRLRGSVPALFVEGADSANKTITDILVLTENGIDNIMEGALALETARDLAIYSSDINKDGYMEVPLPRELHSQSEAKQYAIDWVAYDLDGERHDVFTTYHNRSDGWFFILPKEWVESLGVRRDDSVPGERTIIFSLVDEKSDEWTDFLRIYTLSGDNKYKRASINGRFRLAPDEDSIYCAEIVKSSAGGVSVTEKLVTESFRPIYSDWSA